MRVREASPQALHVDKSVIMASCSATDKPPRTSATPAPPPEQVVLAYDKHAH